MNNTKFNTGSQVAYSSLNNGIYGDLCDKLKIENRNDNGKNS